MCVPSIILCTECVHVCVRVCVHACVPTSLHAYNVPKYSSSVSTHACTTVVCSVLYVASICMHICVYVRILVHIFHCTYIRTKYCVHVQRVRWYVHVHPLLLLPRGLLLTAMCFSRGEGQWRRNSGHVCTIVRAETRSIAQKDLRQFLRALNMKCLHVILDGTRLGVRTSYAEAIKCLLSTGAPQAPVAGHILRMDIESGFSDNSFAANWKERSDQEVAGYTIKMDRSCDQRPRWFRRLDGDSSHSTTMAWSNPTPPYILMTVRKRMKWNDWCVCH